LRGPVQVSGFEPRLKYQGGVLWIYGVEKVIELLEVFALLFIDVTSLLLSDQRRNIQLTVPVLQRLVHRKS
jgi:hypothetical protein